MCGCVVSFRFFSVFIMVDNVAGVPAKGSGDQEQEVPTLAEAQDARLKARFDELQAEERALLTENMELGRQKGDAARRKANLSAIEAIATEARSLQNYLSRAAWQPRERHLPQQEQQQKPQQQQPQPPQQQPEKTKAFHGKYDPNILYPILSNIFVNYI